MNEELYNLSTRGKSEGYGTFGEGTVTKLKDGYHLMGGLEYGYRFGCYIDVVYVDYLTEPEMDLHDEMDISGHEFRLSDGELHLRKPINE